jgi:hypothetical protein
MSKRYIKELPNGGLEVTLFTENPSVNHGLIEVDSSELDGKNIDKCRINPSGKVYEDNSVLTKEEKRGFNKKSAITKLKLIGLTEEEIRELMP